MIEQYGVLPYRVEPSGEMRILLVTSRETGRWIVPKGNLVPGLSRQESAAREAHEEAGLEGAVDEEPIGSYRYVKQKSSGNALPADVEIYPMRVSRQLDDWPERQQRACRWFSQADAAASVAERSLRSLILSFRPADAPGYARDW